ncbi:MAG: hypothetical protein ACI9B8_003220, partial [Sulfitobacter sp.]
MDCAARFRYPQACTHNHLGLKMEIRFLNWPD